MPKPAAYTDRSDVPYHKLSPRAATDRTVARIGPMQGVQPNAKARPKTYAPIKLAGRFCRCRRTSLFKNGNRIMPMMCRPNTIIMTPAIWPRISLCCNSTPLMAEADAPRATNTVENPRINNSAETITRRDAPASTAFPPESCSMDVPPRKHR